jgi:transposase
LPDDIQALKQIIAQLLERFSRLKTENANLKTENEELRQRLKLKSHNSHKPPSSDGLTKKPALPKASEKKTVGRTDTREKRSKEWKILMK